MIKKRLLLLIMSLVSINLYGLSQENFQRIRNIWYQNYKKNPLETTLNKEDYINFGRICFMLNLNHDDDYSLKKQWSTILYNRVCDRSLILGAVIAGLLSYYAQIGYSSLCFFLAYKQFFDPEMEYLYEEYGKVLFQQLITHLLLQ